MFINGGRIQTTGGNGDRYCEGLSSTTLDADLELQFQALKSIQSLVGLAHKDQESKLALGNDVFTIFDSLKVKSNPSLKQALQSSPPSPSSLLQLSQPPSHLLRLLLPLLFEPIVWETIDDAMGDHERVRLLFPLPRSSYSLPSPSLDLGLILDLFKGILKWKTANGVCSSLTRSMGGDSWSYTVKKFEALNRDLSLLQPSEFLTHVSPSLTRLANNNSRLRRKDKGVLSLSGVIEIEEMMSRIKCRSKEVTKV
ncbi:uncharacterized protein LOC129301265 [Prosopis cineraria]|uniref:uncharacterized protein LOC129301265 n=1 Tax=Prosopis cineraria TaxID=364024 RepID=UPI0024108D11|nr:uncharacterized protein LOC129301265 [Prosopis cineraria]